MSDRPFARAPTGAGLVVWCGYGSGMGSNAATGRFVPDSVAFGLVSRGVLALREFLMKIKRQALLRPRTAPDC